jgi:hypothetical protein
MAGLNGERAGVRAAVHAFRQWIEDELLAKGGGGIGAASRVHTAAVAMRRHLAAEDLLKRAGPPGSPQCTLSIDQWTAIADRALRWKETVDRSLSALGLDARTEAKSWYDTWLDEQRREDERKLAERLQDGPPASDSVDGKGNGQRPTLDASTGQGQGPRDDNAGKGDST